MTSHINAASTSFNDLRQHLKTLPTPLLPPDKPSDPSLTDTISSLYLHPSLECLLHLLNNDLPSSHFLCRHMQAPPEYEGMYIHGLLHRIEGDYDNARAWYSDVADSDVFTTVWDAKHGGKEAADRFVDRIQKFQERSARDEEEKVKLEKESASEIEALIQFCVHKFGTDRVKDASKSWSQPGGEKRQLKQEMVSGDKGFRQF